MKKKRLLSILFTAILTSFVFIGGSCLYSNNININSGREIRYLKDYDKFIEDEIRNDIRNEKYNKKMPGKNCIRNVRYNKHISI